MKDTSSNSNHRKTTLVTCLGWESRFLSGAEYLTNEFNIDAIVIVESEEYAEWTANNKKAVQHLLKSRSIYSSFVTISFYDYPNTWLILSRFFAQNDWTSSDVVLDISTMPRSMIWEIMSFLDNRDIDLTAVYHRPEQYGSWQTGDPGEPRIVYRLGGISRPEFPTKLIVTTGYDVIRTSQLLVRFEPDETLLLVPSNDPYPTAEQNALKHEQLSSQFDSVIVQKVDRYSADFVDSMLSILQKETVDHNVLLASNGPKLTAIGMYVAGKQFENVSFCYVPARTYSQQYTDGYIDSITQKVGLLSTPSTGRSGWTTTA